MATKLKELREERNETKLAVSKATGVPYTSLTRLEEGMNTAVNLQHLKALAAHYNQPLDVQHLLGV